MSVEAREMKEIEAAVEGILFASGEPVHIDRICLAAELDRPTAELVLQKLMDYYSFERRGTAGSCAPPRSMPTLSVGPLRYASPPSCPSRRWRC